MRPILTRLACLLLVLATLLFSTNARAAAPDPTFNAPRFLTPSPASGIFLLPDGKFLRFFNTNSLVEQPTGPITRHFPDGSLDPSFSFSREYTQVGAVLRLPDGKFILAVAKAKYGLRVDELLRMHEDGSIDSSFPPVFVSFGSVGGNGTVRGLVLQPDGKLLASGPFTQFGEHLRPGIVRLHPDGGLDTSFAAVPLFILSTGTQLGALALDDPLLQPDGKIVIYGNFVRIGGASYPAGVARLNADGTVDGSFSPSGFTRGTTVRTAALQPDGKVVIGGRFRVTASFAGNPTGTTYSNLPFIRLNTDGTADQSYGYFDPSVPSFLIRDCVLQPDGKLVASNPSILPTIFRFNANGSLDGSFHQPVFQVPSFPSFFPQPVRLALQTDGKLLIGGVFDDVEGTPAGMSRFGVARLHSDGTLDSSLLTNTRTGFATWPTQVSAGTDGNVLINFDRAGIGSTALTAIPNNFGRLLADGSLDTSYRPFLNPPPKAPLQPDFISAGFVRLPAGEIFLFGNKGLDGDFRYGRLRADGTQDPNYVVDPAVISLFSDTRQRADAQEDRGILLSNVYEGFLSAQAVLNNVVVRRITVSGALDDSFALAASIQSALVERDSSTNHPTRVYADPRVLTVQPDGKVVFLNLVSDTTARLVRLNVDGAVDSTFTAVLLEPLNVAIDYPLLYDPLTNVTLQPIDGVVSGLSTIECQVLTDGRIVISGPFKAINGMPSRGIARLDFDGTVDTSFQVGQGPTWTSITETDTTRPIVEQIESDVDGKLLLTGTFEAFNGVAAPGIVRLHTNGTVDTSFVAPAFRNALYSGATTIGSTLARQADGSFLLSGPYNLAGDTLRRPTVLHLLGAPLLTGAVSRKTHGSAGPLDIILPLTGTPGVECRSGGAGGNHTVVFTFNNPLKSGAASVTSGSGTVAGAPTISGKTMAVELTGVTNAQTLTITLQSVTDVASQVLPDTATPVSFLLGDTNGNGTVNSGDTLQTRSRSGQALDPTNFRSDVNLDGFVNSGDTLFVRTRAGTSLP